MVQMPPKINKAMRAARNIDKAKLKKSDIQKVIRSLKKYWGRSTKQKIRNASYLAALSSMEMGIALTSEKTIEDLFYKMLLAFDKLHVMAHLHDVRADGAGAVADLLARDIESGDLFGGLPQE